MTSNYQADATLNQFPAQFQADSSTTATKATRDFRNEMRVTDVIGPDGKPLPNVKAVEIIIQNLSGGLNRVWGNARQPSPYYPYSDLDRVASSSLLTDELGVASLTLKQTLDAAASTSTVRPLTSVNVFNTLAIGYGAAANTSLFKETSATSPTLVAITYAPGSTITNLCKGVTGGANGERMILYREGGVAVVFDDLTTGGPTTNNMAAGTNPGWGHLNSPINAANPGAGTLLMYINGTISSLDSTVALGTAPTAVLTSVPNGGYPIGILKLPGTPFRAYWFFPRDYGLTHSVCDITANSGVKIGKIVSTQLDGTDPQELNLPSGRVIGAAEYNGTIVFWDGLNIWQITDAIRNLSIFKARAPTGTGYISGNVQFQVIGVHICNGDLIVTVQESSITGAGTKLSWERYVPATGSWHRVAPTLTAAGSGVNAGAYMLGFINPGISPGVEPFSTATSFMHICADGFSSPYSQYVPPQGSIPFYQMNQTTADSGGAAQSFATTGVAFSPAMLLENMEGYPFVVEEIRYLGDLANSGAAAAWQLEIATQSTSTYTFSSDVKATATGADPYRSMVTQFPLNTDYAYRLQWKMTLTQSATATSTPNGLPFIIKLLVFTDGDVKPPSEIRPRGYFGSN